MRTASRGFTLVELMIVVAVVGVGAGIALVNMSDQVAEARAQADGVAMANFIRAETRIAKEQMQAVKVKPGAGGNVVNVYAVNKCSDPINESSVRITKSFLSTTKLVIVGTADGAFCWNRFGEPPPPPAKAFKTNGAAQPTDTGPPPTADPELQISSGMKKVIKRAIRPGKAGAHVKDERPGREHVEILETTTTTTTTTE